MRGSCEAPDPWTEVPGAFLGILGLIELPAAQAMWPPNTLPLLGHPLHLT